MNSVRLQLLVTFVATAIATCFFAYARLPPQDFRGMARRGDVDGVRHGLRWGLDPEMRWRSALIASVPVGVTPLCDAAWAGQKQVVELLLAAGADVDLGSSYGHTPLALTAARRHMGIVRLLVSNGADVNVPDPYTGWTALHWATHYGERETVELLLNHGADPNAKDDNGATPLDHAWTDAVVELLRQHGAGSGEPPSE